MGPIKVEANPFQSIITSMRDLKKRERPYVSQLGTDFRGDDTVLSTCFHNHPHLLVPCILSELLLRREEALFSGTVPTQQQTATRATPAARVSTPQGVEEAEFIRNGFRNPKWKFFNGIFHEGGRWSRVRLKFFQFFLCLKTI